MPWIASPVGPYLGLGEAEGGWLVPDDGWFEALDRLATHEHERRQLAHNARAWAMTQTIDALADRWEAVFAEAAGPEASARRTPPRTAGAGFGLRPGVRVRVRPRPGEQGAPRGRPD